MFLHTHQIYDIKMPVFDENIVMCFKNPETIPLAEALMKPTGSRVTVTGEITKVSEILVLSYRINELVRGGIQQIAYVR